MITNDLLNFKIRAKDGTVTYQPFLSEQNVIDFKNEVVDIMQATGLYDKNQKLIYDGDYIKAKAIIDKNLTNEDKDDKPDQPDYEEVEFIGVVHYEDGGYYVVGRDIVIGLGRNSITMEVVQDGEAKQDAATIQ